MIADECRIMAKHVQARRVIILHIIVLQTTTTVKKIHGSVFYSSDRTIKSKPPATDTACEKTTARVLAVKMIVL
jgi:4-hydroxy-3-methylbut-2-enyl diphosphate reductase IspH